MTEDYRLSKIVPNFEAEGLEAFPFLPVDPTIGLAPYNGVLGWCVDEDVQPEDEYLLDVGSGPSGSGPSGSGPSGSGPSDPDPSDPGPSGSGPSGSGPSGSGRFLRDPRYPRREVKMPAIWEDFQGRGLAIRAARFDLAYENTLPPKLLWYAHQPTVKEVATYCAAQGPIGEIAASPYFDICKPPSKALEGAVDWAGKLMEEAAA